MQRYTFWSNSQPKPYHHNQFHVVRANAKIHILKQFTTKHHLLAGLRMLYVLMQRYTFWSNSQHLSVTYHYATVVRANAKIHILKQFTTYDAKTAEGAIVVRANAKIHILKQFTTIWRNEAFAGWLYVLMQRYTFWSNSQRNCRRRLRKCVVRANAKIHILKQFTTYDAKTAEGAIVVRANAKILQMYF